jgi:phage-related protein
VAKSAVLAVRIVSDAKDAVSGIGKATGAVAGFAKAGLVAAGAWAGAKIVQGIAGAVKAAGDLQQSTGAIETVFKGSAGQMEKWAAGAGTSVGLTKNEFNELGTLIGTQLKNGGTAMDQLAPKTNQLIGLGADLSSMFGGSSKEAVEALSSALKGERDPIEKYGVSLSQAKIDAEAAALGFSKVGGTLSTEANQAATLSLIMKQTADAHGNFAKESNTLQGQQQRAKAQWDNIITTLGGVFLPIATKVFGFINTNILPVLSSWADGLGGAGGALDGLGPVLSGVMTFLNPLSVLWQAMLPLLPEFGALVMQLVNAVLPPLKEAFAAIQPAIQQITAALTPLISTIVSALMPIVIQLAQTILPPVIQIFTQIVQAIAPLITQIAGALVPVIQSLMPVVQSVFNIVRTIIVTVLGVIQGAVKIFSGILSGDWSQVWEGVQQVFGSIVSGIGDVAREFFTNLGPNIIGFLGNVGGLLLNAGKAIIDGLLKGLQDAFGGVQDFIGGVGQWIAEHKGPIPYDRRLLVPAGVAIMTGLRKGLAGQLPQLRKTLGTVTDEISGLSANPRVNLSATGARRGAAARPVQIIIQAGNTVADKAGLARELRKVLDDYDRLVGAA